MASLSALLGRIFSRGTELELQGGLDFLSPLSATPNLETGRIEIEVVYDEADTLHTIAAGVIESGLTERVTHTLASEGAAGTDDLDTITPAEGLAVGHVMVLRDNSSTQDITIKHGTGNIHCAGAADFAMADSSHRIALMWSGSFWQELWRSTT
jgi:hypothetical protein